MLIRSLDSLNHVTSLIVIVTQMSWDFNEAVQSHVTHKGHDCYEYKIKNL